MFAIPLFSRTQSPSKTEDILLMAKSDSRVAWVDALRGLAIMIMIPANLSAYLAEPHPMWFRLLSSFAAPMFIMLSAGMVELTSGRHTLMHYLKRGASVICIGALLDSLLWRIVPFTSVDVLYLIGLSIPFVYLLRKPSTPYLLCIAATILLGTSILQTHIGYNSEPLQINFANPSVPPLSRILQSWFIDGWFPILPWLGISILGAVIFRARLGPNPMAAKHFLVMGLALSVLGVATLFLPTSLLTNLADDSIMKNRDGYSEIFYPPTFCYSIAATGVVILATGLLPYLKLDAVNGMLRFFGQHSMLIYVLHQAIGARIIAPIINVRGYRNITSMPVFLAVVVAVYFSIFVVCYLIDMLKTKYPPRSVFVRTLFGA